MVCIRYMMVGRTALQQFWKLLLMRLFHSFILEDIGIPWSTVVMWGLISSNFFFTTGHQATVPNIRWDAAFVGFYGHHNYYAFPALLITLNTFASHMLSTVSLPLLLFWPHFRANVLQTFDKNPVQKSSHGEFHLHEDRDKLRSSLFKLILSYLLFHLCKVYGFLCYYCSLIWHKSQRSYVVMNGSSCPVVSSCVNSPPEHTSHHRNFTSYIFVHLSDFSGLPKIKSL